MNAFKSQNVIIILKPLSIDHLIYFVGFISEKKILHF